MSDTKKYYWLKLKTDFFNEREVKKLRRIAGGDTYVIIYLKMQLLSIKNEGVITFERTESHLDEQLALELDEELENVRMTLAFLHSNALIEPITEVDFLLNKVPSMIGAETSSAERMRRLRMNETKQIASHCDTDVRLCDTNVQKSDTEIEIDLDKELKKDTVKSDTQSFVLKYKELKNLPVVRSWTDSRKKHIEARIKEYGVTEVLNSLDLWNASDFLTGKNDKQWVADIDWIVKPTNFSKLIEGKYTTKQQQKQQPISYGVIDDCSDLEEIL